MKSITSAPKNGKNIPLQKILLPDLNVLWRKIKKTTKTRGKYRSIYDRGGIKSGSDQDYKKAIIQKSEQMGKQLAPWFTEECKETCVIYKKTKKQYGRTHETT